MTFPAATGLLRFREGRDLVRESFERLWAETDVHELAIRLRETKAYKQFVTKELLAELNGLGEDIIVRRHGRFSLGNNAAPKTRGAPEVSIIAAGVSGLPARAISSVSGSPDEAEAGGGVISAPGGAGA